MVSGTVSLASSPPACGSGVGATDTAVDTEAEL